MASDCVLFNFPVAAQQQQQSTIGMLWLFRNLPIFVALHLSHLAIARDALRKSHRIDFSCSIPRLWQNGETVQISFYWFLKAAK